MVAVVAAALVVVVAVFVAVVVAVVVTVDVAWLEMVAGNEQKFKSLMEKKKQIATEQQLFQQF